MQTVQQVYETDLIGPPPPLRESSRRSFGLDEIAADRYVSAEFHCLEMDRLWTRV